MRRIVTVEEQTAGMKQHKTGFMFALLRDREIRRANARNWRRNDIDKFIRRRISVLCHVSFVALRQRCVKNGTCPCCTHTSYILIILYRSTDFVITLPLRTPSLLFPFKFCYLPRKCIVLNGSAFTFLSTYTNSLHFFDYVTQLYIRR